MRTKQCRLYRAAHSQRAAFPVSTSVFVRSSASRTKQRYRYRERDLYAEWTHTDKRYPHREAPPVRRRITCTEKGPVSSSVPARAALAECSSVFVRSCTSRTKQRCRYREGDLYGERTRTQQRIRSEKGGLYRDLGPYPAGVHPRLGLIDTARYQQSLGVFIRSEFSVSGPQASPPCTPCGVARSR